MTKPILLDTHCWIWLQAGFEKQFSRRAKQEIERSTRRGDCFVSVISVWELGMLCRNNRVKLKSNPEDWINNALAAPGILLAQLTVAIALESSRLPGEVHGDPADRMLIATARQMGWKLVTADQRILAYGRSGYLDVLEAN